MMFEPEINTFNSFSYGEYKRLNYICFYFLVGANCVFSICNKRLIKVENFDKEVFFMCDVYIFPSTQPETVQACCKYIVDFTAAWGNNQLSENLYMWTSCTRFFVKKLLPAMRTHLISAFDQACCKM